MDNTCDDCPFRMACPFKANAKRRCAVGKNPPLSIYLAMTSVAVAVSVLL